MPVVVLLSSCAQGRAVGEGRNSDAKLDPEIVQGAVTFEPGTKEGAVVPEISAPSLRAVMVEQAIVGNRLIERHREWILGGDVRLLGIPDDPISRKKSMKAPGATHEN